MFELTTDRNKCQKLDILRYSIILWYLQHFLVQYAEEIVFPDNHKKDFHGSVVYSEPACSGHDRPQYILIAGRSNQEFHRIQQLVLDQCNSANECQDQSLSYTWSTNMVNLNAKIRDVGKEPFRYLLDLVGKT